MEMDAEVAIIGAGPLGIELAIALKQNGITCLQFDKGQVAQAIYDFPFQTQFFSSSERIGIAGIPVQTDDQQKCTRERYLSYIRSVVLHNRLHINTYEEVRKIRSIPSLGFQLETVQGNTNKTYSARFVVLATGGTSTPRRLNVPGEDLSHVSSRMEDPHCYFGKRVLIIGGKNSAVESAIRCFHAGAKPALALRKSVFDETEVKYWLLPELLGRIKRKEIDLYPDCEVVEISMNEVKLSSLKTGQIFGHFCDFVLKAIGFDADMSLFRQLGIELEVINEMPSYDENTMETNVPGIYVLGTAIGGTQKKYKVYIENTHHHVGKILASICEKLDQAIIQKPWYMKNYVPQGPLEE